MRILLAVDDSAYSIAAANAVINQNVAGKTSVRILHVVEPLYDLPMYDAYGPPFSIEKLEKERLAQGDELVKRVADNFRSAGFETATSVQKGDAKKVILEAAAIWNADLIVVASHGRSGVNRFLLGSVSEAVTRYAPCSVEIVRSVSPSGSSQGRDLRRSEKCGHPACTCTSISGTYCSAQCEAMSSTPDIDCRCGHPVCQGRAH